MAHPGRWVWGLVLAALLGGTATVVDVGSRVADQGLASPRRALALLGLAVLALLVAAPGAVGQLRVTGRGPVRLVVAVGFVAFDWFTAVIWWRWRRGAIELVPAIAVAGTALVSVVLLVTSAASVARTRVRVRHHDRGRGD